MRSPLLAHGLAAIIIASSLSAVAPASAAPVPAEEAVAATAVFATTAAETAAAAPTERKPKVIPMGAFSTADYEKKAAKLPTGLVGAIKRDLKISAAQYLARSAAAVRSTAVVDSLRAAGVKVNGSKMTGTKLTVYVDSAADVSLVTGAGAVGVLGAAPAAEVITGELAGNTYGGLPFVWPNGAGGYAKCSIGFSGAKVTTGAAQFATAGHCVTTSPGPWYTVSQTAPSNNGGILALGTPFATPVAGSNAIGNGYDHALFDQYAETPQPYVAMWGGETTPGAPLSSGAAPVLGIGPPVLNAVMCRSGSTTGWRCGVITSVNVNATLSGYQVFGFASTACVLSGDSGGSAISGNVAIGVVSGSNFSTCSDTDSVSIYFAMASPFGTNSVAGQTSLYSFMGQLGSVWEPSIFVSTPTVIAPAAGTGVLASTSLQGTLPGNVGQYSSVDVRFDGGLTPVVGAVSASGTWSVPLSSLAPGVHTYTVRGRFSKWSTSAATASGSVAIVQTMPAATVAVTGTRAINSVLTATANPTVAGAWDSISPARSYVWLRNNVPIPGQTTRFYTQTLDDVGKVVEAQVTVSQINYTTITGTSTGGVATGTAPLPSPPQVTVSGTRIIGSLLTAQAAPFAAGAWGAITPTFAYTWYRDGAPIAGAPGATYTQVLADLNAKIEAEVVVTAPGYTPATARSTTNLATGPRQMPAGATIASGTRVFGATLTGSVQPTVAGTWDAINPVVAWKWYRDGVEILGATSSTYTQAVGDVGTIIRARATISQAGYTTIQLPQSPDASITQAATMRAVSVSLSGIRKVGATLTSITTGAWSQIPATLTYEWYRTGDRIIGATGSTYTQTPDDVGQVIDVVSFASAPGYALGSGYTSSIDLTGLGDIPAIAVSVAGTRQVGSTLTSTVTGAWASVGATLSYQWNRNGDPIAGATGPTYVQTVDDIGAPVWVLVTAAATGYATLPQGSVMTVPTLGVITKLTSPKITGTAKVGRTLRATTGTWSETGTTFKYQWRINSKSVSGATKSSYKVPSRAKGQKITVKVTVLKTNFVTTTATSAYRKIS